MFDCLDEHGVYVPDEDVDSLCGIADDDGHIEKGPLFDFARTSKFWEILIKKDVYADQEVLKLMTKTYDLSGRPKGPPKISKLDTINKALNRVSSSFNAFDKDKDGMMNFTEFKNFMAKRKSLPDKALARCT